MNKREVIVITCNFKHNYSLFNSKKKKVKIYMYKDTSTKMRGTELQKPKT